MYGSELQLLYKNLFVKEYSGIHQKNKPLGLTYYFFSFK